MPPPPPPTLTPPLPNQTSVQHVRRRRRGRGRRNGKNATVTGPPAEPSLSLSLSHFRLPPSPSPPSALATPKPSEGGEVSHIIPLQRKRRERAAVSQPQCPRKSKAAKATDGGGTLLPPRAPSRPTGDDRPTEAIRSLARKEKETERRFICIDSKREHGKRRRRKQTRKVEREAGEVVPI